MMKGLNHQLSPLNKTAFSPKEDLDKLKEVTSRIKLKTEDRDLFSVASELDEISKIKEECLEIANAGFWCWWIETGKLWWSDTMFTIFGIDPDFFTGKISFWHECLDKKSAEKAVKHLENSVKTKTQFVYCFKTKDNAGNLREIFASGRVICDEDDNPIRMVGVNMLIPKPFKLEVASAEDIIEESLKSLNS